MFIRLNLLSFIKILDILSNFDNELIFCNNNFLKKINFLSLYSLHENEMIIIHKSDDLCDRWFMKLKIIIHEDEMIMIHENELN